MATYRILSWKHIPSVIEADDGTDEVKLSMGSRFEQLIDDSQVIQHIKRRRMKSRCPEIFRQRCRAHLPQGSVIKHGHLGEDLSFLRRDIIERR